MTNFLCETPVVEVPLVFDNTPVVDIGEQSNNQNNNLIVLPGTDQLNLLDQNGNQLFFYPHSTISSVFTNSTTCTILPQVLPVTMTGTTGTLLISSSASTGFNFFHDLSTNTNFVHCGTTLGYYGINASSLGFTNRPTRNWYANASELFDRKTLPPKKTVKNSIKRALKLISNFGMEEDVKLFLGGDSIEVSHPDSLFKFVMKKNHNNLLYYTEHSSRSTPYDLLLYTKTNIELARLCVVVQDTPILDQVFSLALFVKTGNEEEILKKANFFGITNNQEVKRSIANKLPYLQDKLRLN